MVQSPASPSTGTHAYELEAGWGTLPDGWTLGQTAVATDGSDNVYLFNRGPHPMVVLDRDGNYLRSWGEDVLTNAHGIFVAGNESVYLPLREPSVVLQYSLSGTLQMTLGTWNEPSDTGYSGHFGDIVARPGGPFNRPTDVAVSPWGEIYVSDGYGNCRVHRFAADGTLLQSWGEPGKSAPGHFHLPHGVWAHTDGRVIVADRENNRIQVFTAAGVFITQWNGLLRPSDIYVDNEGLVFVAELDSLVAIFTLDGDLLARWGSPTSPAPMGGGHSIWADARGDIYVGQNQEQHRLLKYRRK